MWEGHELIWKVDELDTLQKSHSGEKSHWRKVGHSGDSGEKTHWRKVTVEKSHTGVALGDRF